MPTLLCITSAWHKGKVRSRAAALADDRAPRAGCVHELPTFTVTDDALKKICHVHERGLAHGRTRCPLDVTAALQRRARERDLPVRIEAAAGVSLSFASAHSTSLADVLKALEDALPGQWLLFAPGGSVPLPPSPRLVKDAVLPAAAEFVLRAVLQSRKRKRDNANRIQALTRLACASGGGTEAERRRAAQKLKEELSRA
jgi:hypothetical protein